MERSRRKPPTMQEIAAAAGVSVTTVSHALSGKRPVSASTLERVMRIIRESGYVPDSGAQRLKTGRSRIVGLTVPDIAHWYFGRIAKGVEQVTDERDYGLIVCGTANSNPANEHRYFNMLRTRMIDGLIHTTSREMTPGEELRRIADEAPIVLADEPMPTLGHLPFVTSANEVGARGLGQHLASLGHERAVIISGYRGLKSQVDRVNGFKEFFPRALVLYGDFEIESGYELTSDLLANGVKFTALLAGNDLMAIGAMQRLREAGLSVPDDVSVVGFDDIEVAAVVTPGLTTVRQDMLTIGRESARILLDGLEAGELLPSSSVTLPVEIVHRGSTAPAKRLAAI